VPPQVSHPRERAENATTFSALRSAATNTKPRETIVYSARNIPATDLANTIFPMFSQPDGEHLVITSDAASNNLILSGAGETVAEATRLLQQLDRQPKSVSVDIWIVDTRSTGWESTANKEISAALTGSQLKFVELLQRLQAQKQAVVLNHLQLTGLEGQESMVQIGEQKPRITATARNSAGRTSSVRIEDIGTTAKVITRVNADHQITLSIDLAKSFSAPEESGVVIAEAADGTAQTRSPSVITVQSKSTLNLLAGELTSLNTLAAGANEAGGDIRVIVSATIVASASNKATEK
jgi:type II secretory pathway component GspD/PulD (secretin)